MKKTIVVALAVLSIAGVVEFSGRALQSNNQQVLVADGSDPMPICRHGKPTCPPVVPPRK